MSERRRLLMAQGEEDNPWEKLDYLTIVPLENRSYTVSILPAWLCTEVYEEEFDEYYYYYEHASIEYSVDDGSSWSRVRPNDDWPHNISVQAGKTLKLRGALRAFLEYRNGFDAVDLYATGESDISVNIEYALAGSPMSLLTTNLNNAFNKNQTLPDSCFCGLFRSDYKLVKILNPKTFLPHETTSQYVYCDMFNDCKKLINAPYLPASQVKYGAYTRMFANCVSLIEVPMLSFSVVGTDGASEMFSNCTALKKVSLNLSSSGSGGFGYMFYRCYSLIEASGQIVVTLASYCCQGMFGYCSSLVIAPELPSEDTFSGCYNSMFYNCSSLNYIKAMFTAKPSSTFLYDWVYGVASTGTFVKNKDATWTNTFGRNAIPTGWTVITE